MPSIRTLFRAAALTSAVALTAFSGGAQAKWSLTVLHNFGGAGDGAYPFADLRFDSAGNLYGTTVEGGTNADCNCGTVFKIAPDGTENVLHSFDGKGGGSFPLGGIVLDRSSGALIGVTQRGGKYKNCAVGCGVIFRVAPDGTETVLHSFDGKNDGSNPLGRLIGDSMGNFYGVAEFGNGGGGYGTVFKLAPDGTFTVLHTFTGGAGGGNPQARLLRDSFSNLYGTTQTGGDDDSDGTVFKLAPDGTFTVLHIFSGADGSDPIGGLARDRTGNLYGTTDSGGAKGGGGVFKLAPDGTYTLLHSFGRIGDGVNPQADLVFRHGVLYGATAAGGTDDNGTIYSITKDGTERVLHRFAITDGSFPYAAMVKGNNGVFYGTTAYGGANYEGVVFSLTKR